MASHKDYDRALNALAHRRSIKTAFAASRLINDEFPGHKAKTRRALKRRIHSLKARSEQSKLDDLAKLQARHQNYLDYVWQTDKNGAFRAA